MSEPDKDGYVKYALTINGKEHSITARGWYYEFAVAELLMGKWVVTSWHGAKEGTLSSAKENAEKRANNVLASSGYRPRVLQVGKDYTL